MVDIQEKNPQTVTVLMEEIEGGLGGETVITMKKRLL
jgi:hypothetical protein